MAITEMNFASGGGASSADKVSCLDAQGNKSDVQTELNKIYDGEIWEELVNTKTNGTFTIPNINQYKKLALKTVLWGGDSDAFETHYPINLILVDEVKDSFARNNETYMYAGLSFGTTATSYFTQLKFVNDTSVSVKFETADSSITLKCILYGIK